jgi:hypothetical protein
MSTYTIKLEQVISDVKFGDFLLAVQYDDNGPKVISVEGEKISLLENQGLRSILNYVNFLLIKKLPLTEIQSLNKLSQTSTVDQFVGIILGELAKMPQSITQLKKEDIVPITVDFLG